MAFEPSKINKYESTVQATREAERLVKNALAGHSHCILLQSEDTLMLDVLAFIYIRAAFHREGEDISARLVSDSIPDVIMLPHGDKVLTEDIEFIVDTAYLTPTEFDTKIYLIDKCETMNEASQNKLLKLLEEPPSSCRFLLKCTSKYALLPTVLSRSEVIEVQPLEVNAVLNTLEGDVQKRQRDLIGATCFGRLDYAERVLKDGAYLDIEDAVFEVFFELRRSSDLAKAAYRMLAFKDYLDTIVFYIECILHDCMVYSIKEEGRLYFAHREREIAQISRVYPAKVVLNLTEAIKKARLRIKSYGNQTGIVDELLFSLLEEKTKWQKLLA